MIRSLPFQRKNPSAVSVRGPRTFLNQASEGPKTKPRMKVHQLVYPQEFREDEWLKIRTRVFGFFYFHPQKLGLRPTAVFQAEKNFWVACQLALVNQCLPLKIQENWQNDHTPENDFKKKLRFQKSPCSLKQTNEVILGSHLRFFGVVKEKTSLNLINSPLALSESMGM